MDETEHDEMGSVGNFLLDGNIKHPIVLKSCAIHWPCTKWTLDNLSDKLKEQLIKVRLGYKNKAQWEGECKYEMVTLRNLLEWCNAQMKRTSAQSPTNKTDDHNLLMKYDPAIYWCYADYKYMVDIFSEHPDMLKGVCWSDLGFEGYDGTSSTIWIGSEGANTPCHYDTYGCNLVLQIAGKKKWQLFPPYQTDCLYPTRIPYEESSVFSEVDIKNPDLRKYSLFQASTPYIVTLEPGDILFVPHHWWHYVESLETSISINCWMDLACDDESRLTEAITRTLFCKLYDSNDDDEVVADGIGWLNPTETVTSSDVNMKYLNKALKIVNQNRTSNKFVCTETSDDPAIVATSGASSSLDCLVMDTGKRKVTDDVLQVKAKRSFANDDIRCLDFFKNIGITIEIVPCHEIRTKEGKGKEPNASDIDSKSDGYGGNVDMKHLLQCLTHPRIVNEVSKLLLERL